MFIESPEQIYNMSVVPQSESYILETSSNEIKPASYLEIDNKE